MWHERGKEPWARAAARADVLRESSQTRKEHSEAAEQARARARETRRRAAEARAGQRGEDDFSVQDGQSEERSTPGNGVTAVPQCER